jgi:hypothetical protein
MARSQNDTFNGTEEVSFEIWENHISNYQQPIQIMANFKKIINHFILFSVFYSQPKIEILKWDIFHGAWYASIKPLHPCTMRWLLTLDVANR